MKNCYRINDAEIIHETIDGEVMLLNLTNGNYFSLDNVGVLIWDMIIQTSPVNVLFEAMTGFDFETKPYMKETIQKVILQMLEEGLILPCDDKMLFNRLDIVRILESKLQDGSIRFEIPVLHMYKDIQEKYAHPCGVKAI